MKRVEIILLPVLVVALCIPTRGYTGSAPRPNILFILANDLGYGDVGVFYQNQRAALKDRSVPFLTPPRHFGARRREVDPALLRRAGLLAIPRLPADWAHAGSRECPG